MSDGPRARYLNDHMAGAVAALELLGHLESAYAGTHVAVVVAALRGDIEADRQELAALMHRLDVSESAPRKAAAWLAEHVAELKLRMDDRGGGALRLLEGTEAVALGIEGKLALWNALAAAAVTSPELQGIDYVTLAQRAVEQRNRIESLRLEGARGALGTRS
jgi:hypothetical protein